MATLLKPAMNQTAYLKLGLLGFEGSGKTYTAVDFAIGMTKLTKGSKVAFFDTEKGSDFHIKRFKEAGIELFVHKGRSFQDLCTIIQESEHGGFSFLIIDSITHVWRELTNSYLKKSGRKNLHMKDWQVLKTEWSRYTDLYVNSKLNIAMLGRAGYEYDMDEDEDGKKEIVKSGTKMKVETETGFEPDLLLEMFRARKSEVEKNKKAVGFINRCVVLKDRTDTMNGRFIDRPAFKDFKPIIDFLNLGGEHIGVDLSRSSEGMFEKPDYSYHERQKQVQIALEELQALLIKGQLDGTSADAKKKRVAFLEKIFGTSAKTKIESMRLEELLNGLQRAKAELAPEVIPLERAPLKAVVEEAIPF